MTEIAGSVRAREATASNGVRLFSPSAARNRDPILHVLRRHLPSTGTVLEIASGTGEHVTHFGASFPHLQWQPTDIASECRASIDAWASHLANVRPSVTLDAASTNWPIEDVEAVVCINMIHIAPWAATEGLIAGAARRLARGGLLALYGPFRWAGLPMEPGNAAFDADLRRRNPAWGLREVEAVVAFAAGLSFAAPVVVSMPSDNLMLLFRSPA